MGEPNLQEVHDFLIDLAKKAGEMILAANPSATATGSKKNCQDPESEIFELEDTADGLI